MVKFDVLMASFNRANVLKNCLESFPAPLPIQLGKIKIVILKSDHATKAILEDFFSSYPIEIIEIETMIPPGASRNIMIENSKAEFLCFLDDDLILPSAYFEHALEIVDSINPDVFGGPDCSIENKSQKQDLMNSILSSRWVMGPTNKRHKRGLENNLTVDETALTLCNLWIKRSVFVESSLRFDEGLRRSEENLLLEQLVAKGYRLKYFSKIFVHHLRRESLWQVARIQYLSGYYRSICFYKNPKTFKLFFLIPLLAAIIAPFFFAFANIEFIIFFSLVYLIKTYFVVMKDEGILRKIWGPNIDHIWGMLFVIVVHFFFSYGLLWGGVLGWKDAKRS